MPSQGPKDASKTTYDTFDFAELSAQRAYKLLSGAIVPRPIAWVTTVDLDGRTNAAPYSFFNCLSADPPIVALGVENHDDMRLKDTAANIRMTEEFTVNIVDFESVLPMVSTAQSYPPEVCELAMAGIETQPGVYNRAPQIVASPIRFECRKFVGLNIGKSREIILGEVVAMHSRHGVVDPQFRVDYTRLDAVGRLAGASYCRTNAPFSTDENAGTT